MCIKNIKYCLYHTLSITVAIITAIYSFDNLTFFSIPLDMGSACLIVQFVFLVIALALPLKTLFVSDLI